MIAKYPGRCAQCKAAIPAGTDVSWDPATKTIKHRKACQVAVASADDDEIEDFIAERTTFASAAPAFDPIPLMPGSPEQETIWEYLLNGTSHVILNCGPGTGKTWTAVQYCLREKYKRILFCAFNKHIATEANGKLRASGCVNVTAATLHSVGYQIIRGAFKSTKVDSDKMSKIFESICPAPKDSAQFRDWRKKLNMAAKLAGFVKNYLLDYRAAGFAEQMEKLADHHGLELDGNFLAACDLVPEGLDLCKQQAGAMIDFDDMIWLPIVLDLPSAGLYDVVIGDEAQDFNACQHALILRLPRSGRFQAPGRLVIIGDARQAIYSFRGAVSGSIEELGRILGATPLGVTEFPLTITRRCPKLHVQMAQSLYPNIQALDDAPLGVIQSISKDKAIAMMAPGDMAICRVNAMLITIAYALIKRGVRPLVKGRDIGKGLISLINLLEKDLDKFDGSTEIVRMHNALEAYYFSEYSKLAPLGEKAAGRIGMLQDKCECMKEVLVNSVSIVEMRARIESLFSDEDATNAVTLGTIHRTKGLEAARVFVLAPELIPHPLANKDWEKEDEKHLAWIAVTRAKFTPKAEGTLIFCGGVPPIFG